MANSPSHKFGQLIGELLEEIMEPLLQKFCTERGLYLDKKGPRPARKGCKLTWCDKYGNNHDLDFVIEKDGTNESIGKPVAFIEAAWRRYTKHSRNKTQEIQGAILPIVERFEWDKPFIGVILAGQFTAPSLKQMESSGFAVALFSYETIIAAFESVGVDVRFTEKTPHEEFSKVIVAIKKFPSETHESLKKQLIAANATLIEGFLLQLIETLDKQIEELLLIPLYGKTYHFESIDDMVEFINNYSDENKKKEFVSFRIFVRYSNKSFINTEFKTKDEVFKFLKYIAEC